jgi:hypothetical protein
MSDISVTVRKLQALRAKYAAAVERRERALRNYRKCAGEARHLKGQIHALEHPPQPRRVAERGLRPDDDLSFLGKSLRYPKDPQERRLEQRRRERIRTAIEHALFAERRRTETALEPSPLESMTTEEFIKTRDREDIERLARDREEIERLARESA